MDEQRKCFLEMESTAGEDAVRIVERTIKDWEYYINLVGQAAAGFKRTDSDSERSLPASKILSNSIARYRETFMKGRVDVVDFTVVLFKEVAPAAPALSSHHPD